MSDNQNNTNPREVPQEVSAPEAGAVDLFAAIGEAARGAAIMAENVAKLDRLFAYPAADESKDRERLTFVEIGGGSTHLRIGALTRREIETLDLALKTILYARHAAYRNEMAGLCRQPAALSQATEAAQ